jgi:hypothetical protein
MFDSGVLGVVIGLILAYFLLSLLCSGINELVETVLRRRAKYLEAGILDLLGPIKDQLYEHPIIAALSPQKGSPQRDKKLRDVRSRDPSYIPPRSFSQALVSIFTDPSTKLTKALAREDITLHVKSTVGFAANDQIQIGAERMQVTDVKEETTDDNTKEAVIGVNRPHPEPKHLEDAIVTTVRDKLPSASDIRDKLKGTIDQLPSGHLRGTLSAFINEGAITLDRWREDVEGWFDEKMDRVSGWYARRTRWFLFGFAIGIVLLLNADTVVFARTLWKDATVREAVVAQARIVTESGGSQDPCEDPTCVANRLQDVKALNLPLGWPDLHVGSWGSDPEYVDDERVPHSGADWWAKALGLLLTAVALMLGAPFWFDLLNKITNFRTSGPPPPAPDKEGATILTAKATGLPPGP